MKKEGDHFMLSAYALDNLQKTEVQFKKGLLVYSRETRDKLKEALDSANYASGLKPALVRLAVVHGFHEHIIIGDNHVKPQPPTDSGTSLSITTNPIIADVRDEMRVIREVAKKNGTYGKAPNGRESNLPPHQWELVRTVGFKKWFGDWEHDPENASKVVDENGEPLRVYHGTDESFSIFRRKYLGAGEVSPPRTFIGH